MARMTLLELVQSTLNAMDSDYVTTILETEESSQVTQVAKEVYLELINREEWEFLNRGVALTSPMSTATPTSFIVPDTVRRMTYLGYQTQVTPSLYKKLDYLTPDQFLSRATSESSGGSNQLVTLNSGLRFYVGNERPPQFYTSFDDTSIVCDSFESSVESFLSASKVTASAFTIPTFTLTDNFVPDLPAHMFPFYLAELKETCFQYFKQTQSNPDRMKALRQLAQARRQSGRIVNKHDYYANRYGRR